MFHSEIFNLHKRLGIHFSLQLKLKSNINVKTHSVINLFCFSCNEYKPNLHFWIFRLRLSECFLLSSPRNEETSLLSN